MTLPTVKEFIINSLRTIYDEEESLAIANTLLSHVLSYSVLQSFDNITPSVLEATSIATIEEAVRRLLEKEPLQYILEEAWFYDLPFYVNKHVLIPRPETEELVDWVMNSTPDSYRAASCAMLDIGTGSGCIPITLKKHFPTATVYGLDVSEDALRVAKRNAQHHQVSVQWIQADILHPEQIDIGKLDVIVSNPPYITESEKPGMHANVLQHEPHLALFVTDNNTLQFYEAITRFASNHLHTGGQLYFEINAAFGVAVKTCLEEAGFSSVTVLKDMQGKDRMVKGVKHQ
jgi:release factor glutamine methyltransferase